MGYSLLEIAPKITRPADKESTVTVLKSGKQTVATENLDFEFIDGNLVSVQQKPSGTNYTFSQDVLSYIYSSSTSITTRTTEMVKRVALTFSDQSQTLHVMFQILL